MNDTWGLPYNLSKLFRFLSDIFVISNFTHPASTVHREQQQQTKQPQNLRSFRSIFSLCPFHGTQISCVLSLLFALQCLYISPLALEW